MFIVYKNTIIPVSSIGCFAIRESHAYAGMHILEMHLRPMESRDAPTSFELHRSENISELHAIVNQIVHDYLAKDDKIIGLPSEFSA